MQTKFDGYEKIVTDNVKENSDPVFHYDGLEDNLKQTNNTISPKNDAAKSEGKKQSNLSFLLILLLILVAIIMLRMYVIEPVFIPSASMENTYLIGDQLLTEKISPKTTSVKQRDVIIFNLDNKENLIKRVIATEGQTINIVDGAVIVDGVLLDESKYLKPGSVTEVADKPEIKYPYTVPEGYSFVMGDNRNNSTDSRYFGAIPNNSIISRPLFTYWPLDRIGVKN